MKSKDQIYLYTKSNLIIVTYICDKFINPIIFLNTFLKDGPIWAENAAACDPSTVKRRRLYTKFIVTQRFDFLTSSSPLSIGILSIKATLARLFHV